MRKTSILFLIAGLVLLARCGGDKPAPQPDGKHSVQIGTPALADTTYSWAPIEGLSDSTKAQPIASPKKTTSYTVTAKTKCGVATSSTTVHVYRLENGQLVEVK